MTGIAFGATVGIAWLIWWGDMIQIPIFAALAVISAIPSLVAAIIKKLQNRV